MNIHFWDDRTQTLSFQGTVVELLTLINIRSETVIVVRNGEVLTDDDTLVNTDFIRLLSVISGG